MPTKRLYAAVTVIGGGVSGLALAALLKQFGLSVCLLEKGARLGGQICTKTQNGFLYETGPSTGVLSTPETVETLQAIDLSPIIPSSHAKKRYIYKSHRLHLLPSGPLSGIATPLFSWKDKLGLCGEPWRSKGTDPLESVGAMAQRRLGKSIYHYAVDPFVGGVYAGNPMQLTTQYALPKLYRLEQEHGSFIRGAIAKAKKKKTPQERLATKELFSFEQGLSTLVHTLAACIGAESVVTNAQIESITQLKTGSIRERWRTYFVNAQGETYEVGSRHIVCMVPAHALPELLAQTLPKDLLQPISQLTYAPVTVVSVGFGREVSRYRGYGALVPSIEPCDLLGIQFPSHCFSGRTPSGGVLYSAFMGGMRAPKLTQLPVKQQQAIALKEVYRLLEIDPTVQPLLVDCSLHPQAIPQYDSHSGHRLQAIASVQTAYPGLIIGGNLRDGIGLAHRLTQAAQIASQLCTDCHCTAEL